MSASTCKPCGAGTYQPIKAAADESLCIPCAVGNFSNVEGQSSCRFCPSGSYGDAFGLTKCTDCPDDTWTAGVGSIRPDMCAYWIKRPELTAAPADSEKEPVALFP